MKRFIAVLLVMGVIMTAFAEAAVVPNKNTAITAAQTNVVLDMNQNIAVVWFTKGEDNTTWYELTLPANLEQNTTSWIASGNDLYLNWNIVSKDKVQIDLSISDPMRKDASNAIGWNISFTKLSSNGEENDSTATTLTKEFSDSTSEESSTAYLKNGTVYGDRGRLPVNVTTENIYGKNTGVYTAIITATVKTYN